MSIKSKIAALAASPFLFAGAAFESPYVNVEATQTIQEMIIHLHLQNSNLDMKEATGMYLVVL